MARVAVVGAGLAGLVIAGGLRARHEVTLFEKSRGPGGRLATRRAARFEFDHGAQYFRARTAAFRAFLAPLLAAGAVAPWPARLATVAQGAVLERRDAGSDDPHFVGVPGMNAIGRHLAADMAQDVQLRLSTRVIAADRDRAHWQLTVAADDGRHSSGEFDWLIVTLPLAQTRALLAGDPGVTRATAGRAMQGCYTLMLGFDTLPELPFDGAFVRAADISWIALNSSKPGRGSAPALVVHSGNAWAQARLERDRDRDTVRDHLLAAAARATGIDTGSAVHRRVHRWRYANAVQCERAPCHLDRAQRLGIAGDWMISGRVESAFTSAQALLARMEQG